MATTGQCASKAAVTSEEVIGSPLMGSSPVKDYHRKGARKTRAPFLKTQAEAFNVMKD